MCRSHSKHVLVLSALAALITYASPTCMASSNSREKSKPRVDHEEPAFESRKLQRRYEKILLRLDKMKPGDGGIGEPDDWFVAGGAVAGGVNFGVFQGTKDVARRIVEFTAEYGGECQWRVFSRASDEVTARQILDEVKSNFADWQREQEQLARAFRRIQEQQARRRAAIRRTRCGPGG